MALAQRTALVAALGLLGCVGTMGTEGPGEDAPPAVGAIAAPAGEIDFTAIAPSADLLAAADPKLPGFDGWPLAFDASHHDRDGASCSVTLSRGGTLLRTLVPETTPATCVATWDGLDEAEAAVGPGAIDVEATVMSAAGEPVASAAAAIEVVRLGIEEIQLRGARPADRVPLLFRAMDGVREGFYEVAADRVPWRMGPDASEPAEAASLEMADGSPRAPPVPWDDLTSPPLDSASPDGVERDTFDLPTAWVAGAEIEAAATLSADVAGEPGGGEPRLAEVRVVAPGGTGWVADDRFSDDLTVSVRSEGSPVPAVGRYDWSLAWRFEARAPGGEWQPVPGAFTTVHRLYGIVAVPVFDYPDVPHRSWVDVIDRVADWVGGASASADEVAALIVDGVYNDLGLRYDAARGASFYTDYPSGWTGAVFQLSWFEGREMGNIINCSDAGSIVSTYANMVGVDFRYHILQHATATGFDLNYIQPIGFTAFSETPFTSGRGAFRYHAVVGPADGRIFDATLALDGDGTPTAPPHALLLAHGMMELDYLTALSSEAPAINVTVDEQVRVR